MSETNKYLVRRRASPRQESGCRLNVSIPCVGLLNLVSVADTAKPTTTECEERYGLLSYGSPSRHDPSTSETVIF